MTARTAHLLDDDRGYEFRRWTLAALIVLAAHGGLMGSYFLLHTVPSAGVSDVPAVLIDMAPLPSAHDSEPGPVVEEAAPPPEPQVMEIKPPEPVIEPTPPVPMEPPLVVPPEPPKLQEVAKSKEPPPPEAKKVERKQFVPRTTGGPRSVPTESRGGLANWNGQVAARLQSVKRYPSGAESRREKGVVRLRFTLSRSGGVLSRSIVRGSGYAELDQEALAMVQRAAPFPPMPASMNDASFIFNVPVDFH